jgi:hypothetical protein
MGAWWGGRRCACSGVRPGRHELEARGPHGSARKVVDIAPGSMEKLALELTNPMIVLAALALLSAPPAAQSALARSDAALAEADFELALTLAEQAEAEAEGRGHARPCLPAAGCGARDPGPRPIRRWWPSRERCAATPASRWTRAPARRARSSCSRWRARWMALAPTSFACARTSTRARAATPRCAHAPGEDSPPHGHAPARPAGVGWPVWALAGTAVAGAGAAGVLGSLALSKNAECRSVAAPLYAQCDEQATTLETGANIAWTGAACRPRRRSWCGG